MSCFFKPWQGPLQVLYEFNITLAVSTRIETILAAYFQIEWSEIIIHDLTEILNKLDCNNHVVLAG
jgi:hypothetical protein